MVSEVNYNKAFEHYKHLSLFWTDLIYLMASKPQSLTATGPMRKFATNAKKVTTELIESNQDLIEFNTRLAEYYKQLSDTWIESQKQVSKKMPEIPQDAEQLDSYKRVWIDIFENDFTQLFDSKKFGENYGKLVSSELELSKHWNDMVNTLLESADLPSKKEIDEIYKELQQLRRRVSKLEKNPENFVPSKKKLDDLSLKLQGQVDKIGQQNLIIVALYHKPKQSKSDLLNTLLSWGIKKTIYKWLRGGNVNTRLLNPGIILKDGQNAKNEDLFSLTVTKGIPKAEELIKKYNLS